MKDTRCSCAAGLCANYRLAFNYVVKAGKTLRFQPVFHFVVADERHHVALRRKEANTARGVGAPSITT